MDGYEGFPPHGSSSSSSSSSSSGSEKLAQPQWVSDKESKYCQECHVQFTLTNRRHHCRGCGRLMCKKCCNNWLLLPREVYDYEEPQRLCLECYQKISILDFSKKEVVAGPEDAPALLLVHDGIYNRTAWHIQMDILSKQFRVYAPDLPGHGSRMTEKLTVKNGLEVLKSLVETQVPQKKVMLLGMGFGGLLSVLFAGQYPELVMGVVVAGGCFNHSNAKLMYDMKGALYKMLPGGALSGASAMEVDPAKHPDLSVSLRLMMRAGFHYEAWGAIKEILTKNDFEINLRNYHGTVWFINAQNENRSAEKKMLAASKQGVLRVILGGNHLMYWDPEQYPEFHKYIVEFAQSIDALPTMDDHMGVEDLSAVLSDDDEDLQGGL